MDIIGWYGKQLEAQGWTPKQLPSDTQVDKQQSWILGDFAAHVGIYRTEAVDTALPRAETASYLPIFEVQIYDLNVRA